MPSKDPNEFRAPEIGDQNNGSSRSLPGESLGISPVKHRTSRRRHRLFMRVVVALVGAFILLASAGGWLATKANKITSELRAAQALIPGFMTELSSYDQASARLTIDRIAAHTSAAREAANDPLWKLASGLPLLGSNFGTVRELSVAADEVATTAAKPLLSVFTSLDMGSLTPVDGKINLEPLEAASPTIASVATTVDLSHSRLREIDASNLVEEVAMPLAETIKTLDALSQRLRTASQISTILPSMMGSDEAREYLVLVQNNAEIRASGGLPGALAVIRVSKGSIELAAQASGAEIGKFEPPLAVEGVQAGIYSTRLGEFISDVNLTPDFPTTARLAKEMWEKRYGGSIDGVVGMDPVVLAHILEASGPINLPPSENALKAPSLPTVLTTENVVETLLSDVYLNLNTNEMQDAYFLSASQQIFEALASGQVSGPAFLNALNQSYEENRLRVWSNHLEDQNVLRTTALGGSTSGPSVGGASFGAYFNDGTGAKMDFYTRRSVQLVEACTDSDYAQYTVKVKTTNTAPADAAVLLPVSVTGDGRYGTPPGSVQTNVVIYGPAWSHVDTAVQDEQEVTFGSYVHDNRPVGVVTTRLAPGESSEIEMSFVKVVQHADPTIAVTPTVQDVKDVILPTEYSECD